MSREEPSFLPNFLSRIGLAFSVPVFSISDAVHCNRSRSALQPPLQCTASVLAVHCILHANTCISIEPTESPMSVCVDIGLGVLFIPNRSLAL